MFNVVLLLELRRMQTGTGHERVTEYEVSNMPLTCVRKHSDDGIGAAGELVHGVLVVVACARDGRLRRVQPVQLAVCPVLPRLRGRCSNSAAFANRWSQRLAS